MSPFKTFLFFAIFFLQSLRLLASSEMFTSLRWEPFQKAFAITGRGSPEDAPSPSTPTFIILQGELTEDYKNYLGEWMANYSQNDSWYAISVAAQRKLIRLKEDLVMPDSALTEAVARSQRLITLLVHLSSRPHILVCDWPPTSDNALKALVARAKHYGYNIIYKDLDYLDKLEKN